MESVLDLMRTTFLDTDHPAYTTHMRFAIDTKYVLSLACWVSPKELRSSSKLQKMSTTAVAIEPLSTRGLEDLEFSPFWIIWKLWRLSSTKSANAARVAEYHYAILAFRFRGCVADQSLFTNSANQSKSIPLSPPHESWAYQFRHHCLQRLEKTSTAA